MSAAGIAVDQTSRVSEKGSSSTFSRLRLDRFNLPHPVEKSIFVYLSVPGSFTVPFRVFGNDSVAAVKRKIQSFKGFVANRQMLVCDGRELTRNNCLVRDYGVGNGKVLHLVVRFPDLLSIFVRTCCGNSFQLQVERNRNVGHVKQLLIAKRRQCPSLHEKDPKIVCDGEELDDHRLMDDVPKFSDEGVIHLIIHKNTTNVRVLPDGRDRQFEEIVAPPDPAEEEADATIVESKPPAARFSLEWLVGNPKIKVLPMVKEIVKSCLEGFEKGNFPVRSPEGSGGVYFFQDETSPHEHVAVFKPIDEEPMAVNNPQGLPLSADGEGLKRGTRAGEGAFREIAAYILDHPISGRRSLTDVATGFSGVPPTFMIRCLHEAFNHPDGFDASVDNFKIGSLQKFVKNSGSCEDLGPRAFPLEQVHKISVLDIRMANADRHAGNILISKETDPDGGMVLIPIDHGYCLPENFEDCTYEWLYWPQAKKHYNSETVKYIASLDAEEDLALLKYHGWDVPPKCARTFRISTMLLKKGVERGLTPFTIGSIMCRETIRDKSEIEKIVHEAESVTLPGSTPESFMATISDILDRHLDKYAS